MKTVKTIVAFVAFGLAVSTAYGQSFTVTGGGNNATFDAMFAPTAAAAMAADASLTGAVTFDFSVTTGSDILLFDAEIDNTLGMNVPGGWFNEVANGNDVNPPNPTFVNFIPALAADAYITTPDPGTAAAGANTLNGAVGGRLVTHSDSIDNGPATDFNFGRITLIPDANGEASLTLRGTLQTSASPTPVFDMFEYNISLASANTSVLFEDGVPGVSGTANTVDGFFADNFTNASILAANDPNQYPNGVTLFVPTDAAIAANGGVVGGLSTPGVDALLVADTDGTGDLGWSLADLEAFVANGPVAVLPFSGEPHILEDGSVIYGGGTIIASHQTDNGWIHVLDTVPVPEPGSVTLLMSALIGLGLLRRRS